MQRDRTRRDEFPFPDEEIERGGRRDRKDLEDAAHPGDPGIYPPLEDDEEEAGEALELP